MYVLLCFHFVYCNIKYNVINSTDLYMASLNFRADTNRANFSFLSNFSGLQGQKSSFWL